MLSTTYCYPFFAFSASCLFAYILPNTIMGTAAIFGTRITAWRKIYTLITDVIFLNLSP